MATEVVVTVANIDGPTASVVSPENLVFHLPQSLLPPDATPGSILRLTLESDSALELDRRQSIYKLIDDVAIYIRSKTTNTPIPRMPMSARKSRRNSLDSAIN